MSIAFSSATPASIAADWLVVPLLEGEFGPLIQALDTQLSGALSRLRERGDLTGKSGETVDLRDVPGIAASRLLVAGLGSAEKLTSAKWDQSGMSWSRKLAAKEGVRVAILLPEHTVACSARGIQSLATSATVGSVGQALYKAERERFPFAHVTVIGPDTLSPVADAAIQRGQILGEAMNLTRELVNRHPHDMTPEAFAQRSLVEAARLGIQTEVFDQERLQQERMGSLLAVARGSVKPPRVVLFRYQGGPADAPWVSLVGKGVTFDSGGLSIKPSDSMKSMKADMAGAATVLGALTAIARLKLPVNVLGAVGLVENMVSGSAYMLGEVLTARNGTTIEVHNTDAEGRLVLADVLSYVVDQKVTHIIDLATLTGACVVALGEDVTGAFTNNQTLCDALLQAARDCGEDVWQLPMFDSFADQLKCDVADVKNVGTRWGGAITAAKFLEKFVGGLPWVHLDIAGPAYAESPKSYRDGGGTGAMVRTLVAWTEQMAALSPCEGTSAIS